MLAIDLNSSIAQATGHGISREDIASTGGRIAGILADLRAGGRWKGWVDLPLDTEQAEAAARFASGLPREITDAVILGIGGSSLGPLAIHHAARHPFLGPGRRMHFLDNSDPDTVGAILETLDPAATLFVAITKSGSTAETASQLMIAWDRAERGLGARARDHFVFVTDPERGDLRRLARSLDVPSFPVPTEVGGRFSVLSAVGLVPAAIAGVDPLALLEGARRVRRACLESDILENPAALLAAVAWLLDTRHDRHVHVVLTYSDRLAPVGAWFRQIWAESLGKRRASGPPAGPTPVDARGATDQHSLLQLLVQGPPDKLVIFLDVRSRRAVTVPRIFEDLPSFGYLGGQRLADLIASQRRATEMSLALAGTPSMSLTVDDASPGSLGALFYLLEVSTAVAGSLYEVNPYDQPGVEEGKELACGLLGRKGFEARRTEVERFDAARRPDLVIRI